MKIDIFCSAEAGYGNEYHFEMTLPDNTKYAKIAFKKVDDENKIIVEEILFYEKDKNEVSHTV